MITVAIVGSGPAGMSCALWLNKLGCAPCLIDSAAEMGGALRQNFLRNDWVLGQEGKTGQQLAEDFAGHMRSVGVRFMLQTELRAVRAEGRRFALDLGGGQNAGTHRFDALVIAVGTRARGEEAIRDLPGIASVPGEQLAVGPQAFSGLSGYAEKDVLVLGAGDNAYEFARMVAPAARSVTLLARSRSRAQRGMQDGFATFVAAGRGRVLEAARLAAVDYAGGVLTATVDTPAGRQRCVADHLVVQAGYAANSDRLLPVLDDALRRQIRVDAAGYLLTGTGQRTDCGGIYAAGDICDPLSPCVVTALAAGAVAARSIEMDFREHYEH